MVCIHLSFHNSRNDGLYPTIVLHILVLSFFIVCLSNCKYLLLMSPYKVKYKKVSYLVVLQLRFSLSYNSNQPLRTEVLGLNPRVGNSRTLSPRYSSVNQPRVKVQKQSTIENHDRSLPGKKGNAPIQSPTFYRVLFRSFLTSHLYGRKQKRRERQLAVCITSSSGAHTKREKGPLRRRQVPTLDTFKVKEIPDIVLYLCLTARHQSEEDRRTLRYHIGTIEMPRTLLG